MALLNVILLLILIGALVIAGYKMVGPLVQRGKIDDTKTIIKSDVDAIISWSVARCRIPDTGSSATPPTDFNHVVQNPNDAWGGQLSYLYAPELAGNTSCAQICGLSTTRFFVSGVSDSVAFVIASSQYSPAFHNQLPVGTTLNGTTLTATTPVNAAGGSVVGTLTQQFTDPPDILRVVTLNELKARIGCSGYTWGQLRILNNELPSVYTDSYAAYAGTLFAEGGAPAYTWQTAPAVTPSSGLSIAVNPTSGAITITAPPTAGTYTVTITVTDQNGATAQRTYTLKVLTHGSGNPPGGGGSGGINNDNGDASTGTVVGTGFGSNYGRIAFGYNQGNTGGCFWYPYTFPLQGKTLRAYWNFCYSSVEDYANSTHYGDGYTFTLMQGSNPTSYCGTGTVWDQQINPFYDCSTPGHLGEFLSYCGLPGQSSAFEFDIYPNGYRNDPVSNYNHLAVVGATTSHTIAAYPNSLYGDNTHGVGGNPPCDGRDPGCLFGTMYGHNYPVNWLEENNTGCPVPDTNSADYSTHNARVEIHTRCNSDCSQCDSNSCMTNPYTLIKVWIDRSWLGSCTGTCNGTAINGAKCTGSCTGTCDGSSITNAQCIALPWRGRCTGSCDGVSVTNATCAGLCTGTCNGTAITNGTCLDRSWYLPCTGTCDGVPITNAACRIGSTPGTGKCDGTCNGAPISNAVCNKAIYINLGANEALAPDITHCVQLPGPLNQYKVGFTEATGGSTQYGFISNFMLKSYGNCPQATIAPATLPVGTVGSTYAATMTASGGTPPYSNWRWSSSAIPGIATSALPPGLTISNAGVISGRPTTSGRYNTVLISVDDACTADNCTNTVAGSYTLDVGCSRYQVDNVTGSRYDFRGPTGNCVRVWDGSTITNSLGPGQTISRYSSTNGRCTGTPLGTIGYADAVNADLGGAQNYNDCTVGYGLPDGAVDQ